MIVKPSLDYFKASSNEHQDRKLGLYLKESKADFILERTSQRLEFRQVIKRDNWWMTTIWVSFFQMSIKPTRLLHTLKTNAPPLMLKLKWQVRPYKKNRVITFSSLATSSQIPLILKHISFIGKNILTRRIRPVNRIAEELLISNSKEHQLSHQDSNLRTVKKL